MPSRLMMRLMGVTVRLEAADSAPTDALAQLAEQWRDVVSSETGPVVLTAVVAIHDDPSTASDVDVRIDPLPLDSLGERAASQLTLAVLERMSGHALMLHAGAIALDDGRVIGFVGPSGRGKTTAMTALAKTYRYVTDETLVIRADGTVIPYPKPLLIGHRPTIKQSHAASSLGLRPVGSGELRLAALVLLDRRDGISVPQVATVGLVDALIELAGESSYLSQLDAPLATLAGVLRQTGGARRVSYTEARSLPDVVDEILACHTNEFPAIERVEVPAAPATAGWVRTPHTDALSVDERLVVLHDQTISVLDGIGPTVWRTADGQTGDEVKDAVLREHDRPPAGTDAANAVAIVLEELTTAGLVRRA